jgi:hypothetical protein
MGCALAVLLAFLASVAAAVAHESRPAYLEITETAPNRYAVLWRTPLLSGMPLPVVLRFPAEVRNVTNPNERMFADSIVERRVIAAESGLAGKRIEFVGLQATITDVLVRIQVLDGTHSTELVRPSKPWVEMRHRAGPSRSPALICCTASNTFSLASIISCSYWHCF